jgi:putative membrane protein
MPKKRFDIILFLKGMAMGAANVIPGVSGGTIALITGIYERLINAIKSFDLHALKLLLRFKWKDFANYTDLYFVIPVGLGLVTAVFSLAKLFAYLFLHYPVFIWAYFFGLVLASVYYVGKTVKRLYWGTYLSFFIGTLIAVGVTILHPAVENSNPWYLFLNGVIAIISMILPGLSGSFVLILLGNYQLIAIDAINNFNLKILIPFGLGAVVGLLAFSHILSWLFKKYRDVTIALLTGFILGSLSILWPWKKAVYMMQDGQILEKHGKPVVLYYQKIWPQHLDQSFFIALFLMILGVLSIIWIEKASEHQPKTTK